MTKTNKNIPENIFHSNQKKNVAYNQILQTPTTEITKNQQFYWNHNSRGRGWGNGKHYYQHIWRMNRNFNNDVLIIDTGGGSLETITEHAWT